MSYNTYPHMSYNTYPHYVIYNTYPHYVMTMFILPIKCNGFYLFRF